MRATMLMVCMAVMLVMAPAASATLLSTFDTDMEGWSVSGAVTDFVYTGAGGNPGGFIQAADSEPRNSATSFSFISPGSWSGDLRSYIGGTLSFDLNAINAPSSGYHATYNVRIYDNTGGYAHWQTSGFEPGQGTWTNVEIDLLDTSFFLTGVGSFSDLMSDVAYLDIQGDLGGDGVVGPGAITGLDNVRMDPVPEPATMMLLGSGFLGLAAIRRRVKK